MDYPDAEAYKDFKPTQRRVVLGRQPPSAMADAHLLGRTNKAIEMIERARDRSSKAYAKAADNAFKLVKALSEECQSGAMRTRIEQLIGTAFYHCKQAAKKMADESNGANGPKKENKSRAPKAGRARPEPRPTLMSQKLQEAGLVPGTRKR